jgi:hypothetical protein
VLLHSAVYHFVTPQLYLTFTRFRWQKYFLRNSGTFHIFFQLLYSLHSERHSDGITALLVSPRASMKLQVSSVTKIQTVVFSVTTQCTLAFITNVSEKHAAGISTRLQGVKLTWYECGSSSPFKPQSHYFSAFVCIPHYRHPYSTHNIKTKFSSEISAMI